MRWQPPIDAPSAPNKVAKVAGAEPRTPSGVPGTSAPSLDRADKTYIKRLILLLAELFRQPVRCKGPGHSLLSRALPQGLVPERVCWQICSIGLVEASKECAVAVVPSSLSVTATAWQHLPAGGLA